MQNRNKIGGKKSMSSKKMKSQKFKTGMFSIVQERKTEEKSFCQDR